MPSTPTRLTAPRAVLAIVVAVAADVLQLPLVLGGIAAVLSGVGLIASVPIEAVDVAIDLVTAGVMYALLGLHWVLLPTACLEVIPIVDAAPTWTACVLFVVWRSSRARPS